MATNRSLLALNYAYLEKRDYNPIEKPEHGPNNEPRILMYLNKAGITSPAPWCASYVFWCCLRADYLRKELPSHPASVLGWRNWASGKGLIEQHPVNDGRLTIQRGDLFYWLNADNTGHIGFIAEVLYVSGPGMYTLADGSKKYFSAKGVYIRTWEGNSNDNPNEREGIMIVQRWRLVTEKTNFIRLSQYP